MVKLRLLLALMAFPLLPIATAGAVATPPCTDAGAMSIVPLSNGHATYCVSDYGWSDAWFVGTSPSSYDPRFDVLSGDDSPNLHYGIDHSDRHATAGFGWISPLMDAGTLSPIHDTTSPPWTVTTAVHPTAALTVESLVHSANGIDMLITTTLDPVGQAITQTFKISNVRTAGTITDLLLADYFNYHPNGSTAANALKGTVTYNPLSGITITGIDDGTLIADGSMRGERVDDMHGMSGRLDLPIDVLDMVQTIDYHSLPPDTPMGVGDVAGGLAWELGDLAPGEDVTFSIYKLAVPLAAAAEPGTLPLVGLALAGLALMRRRAR